MEGLNTFGRKGTRYESLNLLIILILGFVCLLWGLVPGPAAGQERLEVIRGESSNNRWMRFTDAPHALYHHLSGQARQRLERRARRVTGIDSPEAWKEHQRQVRRALREAVGPFPEKTPLRPRVTRRIEKEDYRLEHIVYESQPGFHVTSTLFIPSGLRNPAPAVMYASGHTEEGYRSPTYQHIILNLVKKGFIVFAFDPVGQGERLEYYDPETGRSSVGGPTSEHSYPGAQAFITGSSQARYMIWDGIRAVDYLLSREEVDPDRIGITGRSGGGTQSAYIAAIDERIYAAAPECYITSFSRLLQSIGPQDAEQNFPGGIDRGLDHADLLEVRAPRPALMLTTTRDFFSIQGARETAREVARIYEAYGAADRFGMAEDDAGHASTPKNREAMYAFFQRHLDNPGNSRDLDVQILSEEELRVTRTGQVSTSLGGETVFSLNHREAQRRLEALQADRQDRARDPDGAVASARSLSGYRAPSGASAPVFAGRYRREGYAVEKYFVRGEGDYPVPYLLMVPERPNGEGVLWLNPAGKSADAAPDGPIGWLARRGYTVLAPDLAGTGEVGSGGGLRTEWRTGLLIGRSLVGVHAGDAVRLTRLLGERLQGGTVYGVARGAMGPVLLHAAAFEPALARVALLGSYLSYRQLVTSRFYEPDLLAGAVAGALTGYDLPDLAASLAPRPLLFGGVTGPQGKPAGAAELAPDLEVIRAAYRRQQAGEQLTITIAPPDDPYGLFRQWLE